MSLGVAKRLEVKKHLMWCLTANSLLRFTQLLLNADSNNSVIKFSNTLVLVHFMNVVVSQSESVSCRLWPAPADCTVPSVLIIFLRYSALQQVKAFWSFHHCTVFPKQLSLLMLLDACSVIVTAISEHLLKFNCANEDH